ncbi:hypothetical protein C0992_011507 [Termitomyces sp. T32_za158]|nr:hypothetical protein C0992_011507 [Termitomyces sp. T32_za158]
MSSRWQPHSFHTGLDVEMALAKDETVGKRLGKQKIRAGSMSALSAVGSLEPLDRPSTPPSRREFTNTLRLAREFIGQMTSHVAMLATVSEDYLEGEYSWDDDPGVEDNLLTMSFISDIERDNIDGCSNDEGEEPGDEGEEPGDRDNRDAITLRLSKIWPEAFDAAFAVEALIENLMRPKKASFAKREDDALNRLLVGYSPTTMPYLKSLLQEGMNNMTQWTDILELSQDIDAEDNVKQCLLKREKFLHENPQGENLVLFICYVVRTVHIIKFQSAWNELSQNERTKYLDEAFSYLRKDDIEDMRFRTPQPKQEGQLKKMRRAFGKAYQRKTTTRNYVLHLYEKFGLGILLDPTWTTPSDMKTGRSVLFGPMLTSLLQQLEYQVEIDGTFNNIQEYLQTSRANASQLLQQVFEAMELHGLWDYVADFVQDFPPGV